MNLRSQKSKNLKIFCFININYMTLKFRTKEMFPFNKTYELKLKFFISIIKKFSTYFDEWRKT
jgi:hypothetical protein